MIPRRERGNRIAKRIGGYEAMYNVVTERGNETGKRSMRYYLIADVYKITYAYHHKGVAKLSRAPVKC